MSNRAWKLSPSDFAFLWQECKRCFYLKNVTGFQRPWRARVLLILALVALLTPLGLYLREGVSADACLDRGGSHNYRLAECDFNDTHPYVPFLERHVLITTFGLVLFLALSGCALLVPRHRALSDAS